jgi:hypothetical protein
MVGMSRYPFHAPPNNDSTEFSPSNPEMDCLLIRILSNPGCPDCWMMEELGRTNLDESLQLGSAFDR